MRASGDLCLLGCLGVGVGLFKKAPALMCRLVFSFVSSMPIVLVLYDDAMDCIGFVFSLGFIACLLRISLCLWLL